MLDEQALRAHLRLYRDRNQASADRELADYDDRDCDDPRRPEILSNYHGAKWATAAYGDLLRRLDAGEFHPVGRAPKGERIHIKTDQVIRVRLNDELFQGVADRVRKDCPDLPGWKINAIAGDVFHMLLDRSVEFLFQDPPEE